MGYYKVRSVSDPKDYTNETGKGSSLSASYWELMLAFITVGYGPLLLQGGRGVLCPGRALWWQDLRCCVPWQCRERPWRYFYKVMRRWTGRSVFWSLGKAIQALSVIDTRQDIKLSPFFTSLDASEKGMLSYTLGMGFTNLTAKKHLKVPWLLHLDKFLSRGTAVLKSGKKRGDLIGVDAQGQWYVFEVKGRSAPLPLGLVEDAKSQAQNVKEVLDFRGQWQRPRANVSVVQLFSSPVVNTLVDPEPEQGLSLFMDIATLLWWYYRKVAVVLDKKDEDGLREWGGRRFRVCKIEMGPKNYIGIGLEEKLFEAWQSGEGRRLVDSALTLAKTENIVKSGEDFAIGADGVVVFGGCA